MIVFEDPSKGNSEECILQKENLSSPCSLFSVGRATPPRDGSPLLTPECCIATADGAGRLLTRHEL